MFLLISYRSVDISKFYLQTYIIKRKNSNEVNFITAIQINKIYDLFENIKRLNTNETQLILAFYLNNIVINFKM